MKKMLQFALFLMLLAAVSAFAQDETSAENTNIPPGSYKSWSALPILMYDNDIGVGYGAKAKFVDFLKKKESFDLILFNSSKGERWYVFTFSLPDIEIRQRKTYPLSFDLKAEYDKYLKYLYYGRGIDSREDDKTEFTHEVKQLQLLFGRGFTPEYSASIGYMFRTIDYYNVQEGLYADELRALEKKFAPYVSVVLSHDTSNSQIHPTRGHRLLLQDDLAAGFLGSKDASFNRITLDYRKYMCVFGEKDVFAFRTLVQYIDGSSIPLFDYSSLGGGNTLNVMRGYALNRFLDRGKFLANIEYRFPIWWVFGGNVFVDLGNVWPRLGDIDLGKTVADYGLGLRLYMADFVVRVDFGFSKEGTRLYFNFGHIF
ncbi:MAG: BamA/TamA family outer membrane protein [Candidatus Aminicenantes bacterium]|nr:BamA/TamA family outer membrane protein [Candidatus Aminicenantes bacterium]